MVLAKLRHELLETHRSTDGLGNVSTRNTLEIDSISEENYWRMDGGGSGRSKHMHSGLGRRALGLKIGGLDLDITPSFLKDENEELANSA